jgi:hypothetical protein
MSVWRVQTQGTHLFGNLSPLLFGPRFLLILLWFRITGQDDHPIVRRGQLDIYHLHGGEFFEHDPRRQSRRQRLQPLFQRDQQTIGQKCNENMGFDSGFELVIDRTDRQNSLNACSTSTNCR